MQKSTLPIGIKTLKSWYQDRKQLKFDLPVQRDSGQWNNKQKSLLIHSILAEFPVPAIYLIKIKDGEENGKDCFLYQALDGKQRLTSIFDFIDGMYSLNEETPAVEVDGNRFDLAGLRFDELSEECKDQILGYRFTVYYLENCTDEDIEEIFARLNNSTPLTPVQKARTVMGTELAQWTKAICNTFFFKKSVKFTNAQIKKEADLEVLLQSMLLLDARNEGYDYKAISSSEVTRYCRNIRNQYNQGKREIIEELMGYLTEAFPQRNKLLRKSNAPMVIVLAQIAKEKGILSKQFQEFIQQFYNNITPEYEENTGSSNTKKEKTQGRLRAIASAFSIYFDLSGVSVISRDDILQVSNGKGDSSDTVQNYEDNENRLSFIG